ncbi:hypothetical protein L2E82_16970 [Cichorium intybus]|uniref:Uncharacterized protein n=1 Tax=Cichorium intybus TaxID=13427 RepID=A0ACB9F700_CICIN|nr:hypothetical protein L2E82_16970 [Cichorium intybus]
MLACYSFSLQNPQSPDSEPIMLQEQQTSSSSFFLFPNPNPLLRSFDIPAPVIHPPGVDPSSFMNPNRYGGYGIEPLPPLDVDPCAASQTEIITKATDLTASEHDPMNEDEKVVSIERCKRKANGSLASVEDADTKRRR